MPDANPSDNPVVRSLQVLLSGSGYNFYSDKNNLRTDDLLVRQKAAGALGEAAEALGGLEKGYRQAFIPPATRENPYPPADVMEGLRGIGRLRDQIRDLQTRILGMPAPAQDKVWWRFRQEETLLRELFTFDYDLVEKANNLVSQVRALTPQAWREGSGDSAAGAALAEIDQILRQRWQLLQMPT